MTGATLDRPPRDGPRPRRNAGLEPRTPRSRVPRRATEPGLNVRSRPTRRPSSAAVRSPRRSVWLMAELKDRLRADLTTAMKAQRQAAHRDAADAARGDPDRGGLGHGRARAVRRRRAQGAGQGSEEARRGGRDLHPTGVVSWPPTSTPRPRHRRVPADPAHRGRAGQRRRHRDRPGGRGDR